MKPLCPAGDPRGQVRNRSLSIASGHADCPGQCEEVLARQTVILAIELERHAIATQTREDARCHGIVERREAHAREGLGIRLRDFDLDARHARRFWAREDAGQVLLEAPPDHGR